MLPLRFKRPWYENISHMSIIVPKKAKIKYHYTWTVPYHITIAMSIINIQTEYFNLAKIIGYYWN